MERALNAEMTQAADPRWSGFDDKILLLYAHGMTVREIPAYLEEMCGAEVSPSPISRSPMQWSMRSKHDKTGLSIPILA